MSFSSYESSFGTPNTDPSNTYPPKSMGYPSSSTYPSAPEAHSKPQNFIPDIQNQSRDILNRNSTKFPTSSSFPNGLVETGGFREPYSSQDVPNHDPVTPAPAPSRKRSEKPPAHVKKPLNAFMLFMKEMRAQVVAECTMKESAAINQILGRKWHALSHEEQAKFYEMARKEKELHQRLYPGWSARDNYAYHAKRRKNRCKYRGYNGSQDQSRDRSPMSNNQDAISMSKSAGNMQGQTATSSFNNNNMFKCPPFYKYPFQIGNMPYGDQRNHSTDDLMPYFGIIDRNQQQLYHDQHLLQLDQQLNQTQNHQQLFAIGNQQSDLESGVKEDCKPRLPSQFLENFDPAHPSQHFTPTTTSWLLGNNHYQPQSTYDLISSASTSPWSQHHQQIEDRFQRQLSQPSCVGMPNHYSTPPYNPNGSFDSRYNDVSSNYLNPHKSSPVHVDPHSLLKSSTTYQDLSSKPTSVPSEYEDPDNNITAPIYGFTST